MRTYKYKAAKCDCGGGSAPDPTGGAYSIPPDLLAGFKARKGKREMSRRGRRRAERGSEAGEWRVIVSNN